MASHRKGRVAEEMKKELSDIIQNNMNDPRVTGLISVTHVEVSRDLSSATVYVSSLGDADEQTAIFKAIRQAAGYIRGELGHRLSLRFVPELHFKADNSIQVGARINELLNQQVTTEAENPDQEDSF